MLGLVRITSVSAAPQTISEFHASIVTFHIISNKLVSGIWLCFLTAVTFLN